MTTPNERLVRMRKSFAKDRSVLAEDYKYFTTPDKAAKQPAKGANHGTQHHLQKQQRGSRSEIPGIHRLARRGEEQGQVLLDAHQRSLGPRGRQGLTRTGSGRSNRGERRVSALSFLREERDE